MLDSMTADLVKLYRRDLERLIAELEAYRDEGALWQVAGEIKNSGGNLALHVIGNLNQYLGAELGDSGYVRDREAEFNSSNVPRTEIVQRVRDTIGLVERVLPGLDADRLEAMYPGDKLGYPMSTGYFLLHLYGHLNYHLGQINYHRRLVNVV
jgi:hypothetical protein